MILDRTQRWILANQYHILAALYPEDADHYIASREALERGYELHYELISEHVYDEPDTMTAAECREVIDILDMFASLRSAYGKLEDKSGIDEKAIRFPGFDGNHETKWLGYARYYVTWGGDRYRDLHKNDFNSHRPTLDTYRRMLAEWEKSQDKHSLTKDDIVRITKPGSVAV